MRRPWNDFVRMLDLPRSTMFEDGGSLAMQLGDSLSPNVMRAAQLLVLGACRAAATALDAGTAHTVESRAGAPSARAPSLDVHNAGPRAVDVLTDDPTAPPVAAPLLVVDDETAARVFAELPDAPGNAIDAPALRETFHPTALLYEADPRRTETAMLGLRDANRRITLFGMTAMGEYHGNRRFNALGDVMFAPPAVRGEVRERSEWLRQHPLDLPSWRESGGPYWRIGRYNLWRLDVLGWPERLALAALVGTNRRVAVMVGPRQLFPRVGFVIETARQMGRTLIGVPIEAAPERLRRAVEGSRDRLMSRRAQVFMGLEAFL